MEINRLTITTESRILGDEYVRFGGEYIETCFHKGKKGALCLAIVRLGELGSLQLSLSGEGAATEDTYTDSMIEKVRVLFRPGTVMQEAINNLAFERVPVKYKKEEEDDGAGV